MKIIFKILKNEMLLANFLSTIFFSTTFPFINKVVISDIQYKLISINGIIGCVATILIGIVWNKFENKIFKHYDKIMLSEIILYGILYGTLIINVINYSNYYVIDALLFCLVTKSIIFGGNKLKSLYFTDAEDRKDYDNNSNIISSIAMLIGYLISIILNLPLYLIFILAWIGISLDNILYIKIYYKVINQNKRIY